jgi:hypothetical protein
MAPQAQLDPKLAEHKDEGLKSSEEAPKAGKHGPRKRVSQACDRCRSRKDKCDGKKPVRRIPHMYQRFGVVRTLGGRERFPPGLRYVIVWHNLSIFRALDRGKTFAEFHPGIRQTGLSPTSWHGLEH